ITPPEAVKERVRSLADEAEFLWGQWEQTLLLGTSSITHFTDGLDERLVGCIELLAQAPVEALSATFAEVLQNRGEPAVLASLALALLVSGSGDGPEHV